MKLIIGLKSTFSNIFFVSLTLILMVWLSVFLYGLFYYMYIPAIAHSRPVYFEFESCGNNEFLIPTDSCQSNFPSSWMPTDNKFESKNVGNGVSPKCTSCQSGICDFPTANVILAKHGYSQLLSRGQPYKILLDLEMPESEVNRRLGMFMVKLSMVSQNGKKLKSSFRSALLIYKSPLLRYFYTFFFSPFLLAGTSSEKQLLTVSLFENYEEDADMPAYMAQIEVHSRVLEIYKATLRIHAHFTGLRYVMYYWPGLSATIGISTNFYFLAMIALFSWYRFLKWQGKLEDELLPVGSASENISTPIPLKRTPSPIVIKPSSNAKSTEAFDLLKRLSTTPEKISPSKEQDQSIYTPLRPQMLNRILEVDVSQNAQLMSPIEEEDSLDVTPVSDEGLNIARTDILRKRK